MRPDSTTPAAAVEPNNYKQWSRNASIFERVVLETHKHHVLVEGRELLWPLVVARTTYDIDSGHVTSRIRTDGKPITHPDFHSRLPKGSHNIRVVFHLSRLPTDKELEDNVPAMPVRVVLKNKKSNGQPTNAWEHRPRCGYTKWPTTNCMVARSVKPAELRDNSLAKEIWKRKSIS